MKRYTIGCNGLIDCETRVWNYADDKVVVLETDHHAECERVVRKAAVQTLIKAMQNTPWGEEPKTMNDWIDRIVREVMGEGK